MRDTRKKKYLDLPWDQTGPWLVNPRNYFIRARSESWRLVASLPLLIAARHSPFCTEFSTLVPPPSSSPPSSNFSLLHPLFPDWQAESWSCFCQFQRFNGGRASETGRRAASVRRSRVWIAVVELLIDVATPPLSQGRGEARLRLWVRRMEYE